MLNIRSIALAVVGIAVFALAAVFTLSLTLFAGALLSMSLIARMISGRAKQSRVYARADKGTQTGMRVWNDGRGTIIDL